MAWVDLYVFGRVSRGSGAKPSKGTLPLWKILKILLCSLCQSPRAVLWQAHTGDSGKDPGLYRYGKS